MKLFARAGSPVSLDARPRSSSTASSLTRAASSQSSPARTPPAPPAPPSPPRRPRLRHGAPPFLEGWMGVRAPGSRRHDLRFCTLAGPTLRYSASPGHDVLSAHTCVYGAALHAEEFPTLKISIRPRSGTRVLLYPETKRDHLQWVAELTRACERCLTDAYAFRADLRGGPFGRVSAALEKATGRVFDVKVALKTHLSTLHVGYAKIEAAVLMSMPEHPCLPALVDVYESARTVYLVTHHIPGNTLADIVAERGALCEADVAAVLHDVLAALTHIHSHAVSHRIVCPDNVVVQLADARTGGRAGPIRGAKLVNFEMAVASMDIENASSVLDSFSENGPLYLRHAMYLAPEVAKGGIGNCAQDMWSLGVLMHYLLVGCTPFDHAVSNLSGLTRAIALTKGTPSFSGPLWRGVTSGAKDLCASMLHADPRQRIRASKALRHRWLNV